MIEDLVMFLVFIVVPGLLISLLVIICGRMGREDDTSVPFSGGSGSSYDSNCGSSCAGGCSGGGCGGGD